MNGMIERQAAIDALARTARKKFNLSDEYSHYLAGLMDGELAIKNLPSVEPNQCRDCALFDPNWRCGFWHRFTIPEGFCHNYKEKEEEEKNDRIER